MNYYKNDIRHVKGDTLSFPFYIEDLHQDLESVYFTCRDGKNDNSEILFEKCLNSGITYMDYDEETDTRTYVVRIAPADTKDLQSGTYYYDVQIEVNSDVLTIMKGRFILEQDVTKKVDIPDDPELYIKEYLDEINGEVI